MPSTERTTRDWMQRHRQGETADPARTAVHGWREAATALAQALMDD